METMNAEPNETTENMSGQEPADTCTYDDAYPMFGRCRVCGGEHYIDDPYQCGKGKPDESPRAHRQLAPH